ncbi:MAG: hypothetical protein KGJ07_09055 [Patescibacteria group bacterium]|nr:hypothetical protein [Patescibacteria group bacterium]
MAGQSVKTWINHSGRGFWWSVAEKDSLIKEAEIVYLELMRDNSAPGD